MTSAARSVYLFGLYLLVTAAVLFTTPNTMFRLAGLSPSTEPWPRVIGVVVASLGVYYVVAARAGFTAFYRASVWVRASVLVAFTCLVLLGWAEAPLIGFGFVDALGALWTWTALRSAPRAA